jgi:hypothetical protein
MVASKSDTYVSPEDYLAAEKVSPIKHEYRQGEIYAMAGAKKAHVIIMGKCVCTFEKPSSGEWLHTLHGRHESSD